MNTLASTYYLRVEDLRISLVSRTNGEFVIAERNVLPGAFAEALREFSSAFDAYRLDVIVSGPTTIVPSPEMPESPEQQDRLFNSCFRFVDNTPRRVFYNEIPALHSNLLFAVKDSVCNAIIEQFPEADIHFVSSLTPLLMRFSEQYDGSSRFRVYLNCRDNFVDVFAFDGRQLAVINSFPANTPADAVYYTLGFSKNVGLNVETTPYRVVGDKTMAQGVVKGLRRFASNASHQTPADAFGELELTHNTDISYDLAAYITCAS